MWRSKQQKTTTLSSTEAEFVALSEAVKEIIFVVQILNSMGISVRTPITVHVDNMGAVFLANNTNSSARTRHIDTRLHFVSELQEDKLIEVVFVKTDENWSDPMTKNVNGEIHDRCRGKYVVKKGEIEEQESS